MSWMLLVLESKRAGERGVVAGGVNILTMCVPTLVFIYLGIKRHPQALLPMMHLLFC